MAKTWAIFRVYDYKGGEISSRINLSYKSFINELCELFDNVNFNLAERRDKKIKKVLDEDNSVSSDIEYMKDKMKKYMEDEDFYSTYAGGGGFCGEIYEVDNGMMKEVDIEDYLDDIAKEKLKYFK